MGKNQSTLNQDGSQGGEPGDHFFEGVNEEYNGRRSWSHNKNPRFKKSRTKDLNNALGVGKINLEDNLNHDNLLMFQQNEISLVDDPGEREYYSTCPNCSARILETGLESEIL